MGSSKFRDEGFKARPMSRPKSEKNLSENTGGNGGAETLGAGKEGGRERRGAKGAYSARGRGRAMPWRMTMRGAWGGGGGGEGERRGKRRSAAAASRDLSSSRVCLVWVLK